jgi:hypothetical protein
VLTYKGDGSETSQAGHKLRAAEEEDGEDVEPLPGATPVVNHNGCNNPTHALQRWFAFEFNEEDEKTIIA